MIKAHKGTLYCTLAGCQGRSSSSIRAESDFWAAALREAMAEVLLGSKVRQNTGHALPLG